MNAASTLIQSAAHEDANIIFGAVLDETMGDDVKITVIATGFRQSTAGDRSRLAAAAPQSAAVAKAPVVASVPGAPPAKPRFASEMQEERLPQTQTHMRESALLADQEIFIPREQGGAASSEPMPERRAEAQPAFMAESFDAGREDELEIPAYLRRGGN